MNQTIIYALAQAALRAAQRRKDTQQEEKSKK